MFDLGFLNAELERAKRIAVARERLVDTLMLARSKHPGGSNRLDDLCLRYKIDNSKRVKHGALLDAELLAEVYVELIGARQANLGLADSRRRRSGYAHGVGEHQGASGSRFRRASPTRNAPRIARSSRRSGRTRSG